MIINGNQWLSMIIADVFCPHARHLASRVAWFPANDSRKVANISHCIKFWVIVLFFAIDICFGFLLQLWEEKHGVISYFKFRDNFGLVEVGGALFAVGGSSLVDFSVLFSFFESIGIGLDKFGLEKKVSESVSKIFGLKKRLSIGLENFGLNKVSLLFSKDLVSKKSWYWSLILW